MILVILCGQISQNSALIVPSMCVAHARVTEHLTNIHRFIASDIAWFLAFWALNIFNPLIYFPTNVVYFNGDNMLKDGQMIDLIDLLTKKNKYFRLDHQWILKVKSFLVLTAVMSVCRILEPVNYKSELLCKHSFKNL